MSVYGLISSMTVSSENNVRVIVDETSDDRLLTEKKMVMKSFVDIPGGNTAILRDESEVA